MNVEKIFIACPISKYLNGNEFTNESFRYFIEGLYDYLCDQGYDVFLALKREEFGEKRMEDNVCTKLDYEEMKETDIVIAIPENSQGVAVELGWASALNKKVVLFQDSDRAYSPLVNAIGTVVDFCRTFYYDNDKDIVEKLEYTIDCINTVLRDVTRKEEVV